MSDDSFVAVQKVGNKYHVWLEYASNDYPFPHGHYHMQTNDLQSARVLACNSLSQLGYCEYGISLLPDITWLDLMLIKVRYWIFAFRIKYHLFRREKR